MVHSDFDLWNDITISSGAGFPCNVDDLSSIAKSIQRAMDLENSDLVSLKAIAEVEKHFTWESEYGMYVQFLKDLCTREAKFSGVN